MSVKKYFKRLIKYVLYEYKQPIIYTSVVEQEKNNIHDNKIYIVTGGGTGLGFYIAKSLIKSGAKVIITGRDKEKLKNASEFLGKNCEFKTMDISNINDTANIMEEIFKKYQNIDGIINNAGVSFHEDNILNVTEKGFDNQFSINMKGTYFITQKYIYLYKKFNLKRGNIIFISSERGSMCDDIPYGLTKVAINSLTQGLSRRFYKDGIRVNAIAPGVTCSNLTKIDKKDDLYSNNASGRVLLPEEIAEIVNYILSDYSKCISGEIINCDGGNHIASYF